MLYIKKRAVEKREANSGGKSDINKAIFSSKNNSIKYKESNRESSKGRKRNITYYCYRYIGKSDKFGNSVTNNCVVAIEFCLSVCGYIEMACATIF